MKALRISFALLCVPRLFGSLILFPVVLGLVFVCGELLLTGVLLRTTFGTANDLEETLDHIKQTSIGRQIIYGHGEPLAPLKICRWVTRTYRNGATQEVPPTGCSPDRLDVAIQVNQPSSFDTTDYERIFNGNVERLHVCKTCHPDVIIRHVDADIRADVYSIWGFIVLNLVRFNEDVQKQYVQAARDTERIEDLLGKTYFHSQGFRESIGITGINKNMACILNIGFLVVLTLWLALKAHRRVLDYFARNGALLPMVAATGRNSFYSAIWILTCIRVLAFLAGSIPLVYFGLSDLFQGDQDGAFFANDIGEFFLWLICIVLSLSLATLVASIADLKHRHHLFSFLYRYIPLGACALGSILWAMTFLFDGQAFAHVRNLTAALPVIGMAPILISPVFKVEFGVLTAHTLLTALLVVLALRYNARWFAAHLEEL